MTGETCRGCGCTDHQACPGGCYWVDPGICSTCFTKELDGRMAGKVVPWVDARTAVDEAFSAGLSSESFDMQPLISSAVFDAGSFQAGVAAWMAQCFDQRLATDITERCDRFLEETLELLQSKGYDRTRVATLVDYVYGRAIGEPAQEVGGVLVTLAALCSTASIDMHVAGETELARIQQPEVMAKIRAKQEAKNALHFDTPLPGDAGAWPKKGDLVRYGSGSTALAILGNPHAGGWHGDQCMGGYTYFTEVTPPTTEDLQKWLDCASYRQTRPTSWADLQIAALLNIRIEAARIAIEAQSASPKDG